MINPNVLARNDLHAGGPASPAQLDPGWWTPMTWFRVDEGFESHPKVLALGRVLVPAVGLWQLCGCWSSKHLTDGYVPMPVVRQYDPKLRYAPRLVEVGLWLPVAPADVPPNYLQLEASWKRFGNGLSANWYLFHDWFDRQPSRVQVETRRRKTAARVSKWRKENPAQSTMDTGCDGVTDTSAEDACNAVTEGGCNAVTPTPCNAVGNAATGPTRISTYSPTPYGEQVLTNPPALRAAPPKRATRIPDDFAPTPAMIEWARTNTPNVGRVETEQFIDYWRAASGRTATKKDWDAAWRFWMRKEQRAYDARHPRTNGHRPATGSKRMDKILAALAPDDPFLTQYGRPAPPGTPINPLIIEGGTS